MQWTALVAAAVVVGGAGAERSCTFNAGNAKWSIPKTGSIVAAADSNDKCFITCKANLFCVAFQFIDKRIRYVHLVFKGPRKLSGHD